MSRISSLLILAGVLACGCGSDDGGPAGRDGCTYDVERALARDDVTSLGPTVQEMGDAFGIGESRSCDVRWAALGDPEVATWTPHDASTTATLSLAWGDGAAERAGGHVPPGSRSVCPSSVTIDVVVGLSTDDGGFDEQWPLTGEISEFSPETLDANAELRTLGFDSFRGSYSCEWSNPWPMVFTSFTLSVATGPGRVQGAVQEWTQLESAEDDGVMSAVGASVSTATLACTGP